jgi:hypothetical protein
MADNGVNVNISYEHLNYVSMYRYVRKSDVDAIESPGHNLGMISSPRTKYAQRSNQTRRNKRKQEDEQDEGQQQEQQEKPRARNMRLNHLEVADFCIKNSISSKTELFAEAHKRKEDGEYDLALYVMNNTEARVAETISKAWKVQNAVASVNDMKKDRLERLRDAKGESCPSSTCSWFDRAVEVLTLNHIDVSTYAKAVYKCLVEGRRKETNVMLVGSANTGKTFMLKPLQLIYKDKLFENPSSDKYGWLGVHEAQVILLNDYRWSPDSIKWKELLNLLEGETVKFPTPKNHFSEDQVIPTTNSVPVLATSIAKIEYKRTHPDYHEETRMMDARWRIFRFSHVFSPSVYITPCAHCFVRLLTDF